MGPIEGMNLECDLTWLTLFYARRSYEPSRVLTNLSLCLRDGLYSSGLYYFSASMVIVNCLFCIACEDCH